MAQLRTEYDALTAGLNSEDLDQIIEVIAAYEAADASLLQAINDLSTSSGSALASAVADLEAADSGIQDSLASAVESLQSALEAGDSVVQADLDAFKASHVIGSDTQAHSSHLDSMEQGDFSTRQMKVKFETVAAGEGLVMGADSFFVMCEAGSTVTLPNDAEVGRKVQLKAGVLGGEAVTVVGMIDGQNGMSLSLDFASVSLVYGGSTWLIG